MDKEKKTPKASFGKELTKLTEEAYYLQSNMVRFLLVENLALKTFLHEKKLLDPEEYKRHQRQAEMILDDKVKKHMKEWIKSHPKRAEILDSLMAKQEAPPSDSSQAPDTSHPEA